MHPHGVGLVDLVAADPAEQFAQRHPGLHAGQVSAEAEVRAAAEADQLRADVTADPVGVGIVEYPLVTVGRAGQQQQHIACRNLRCCGSPIVRIDITRCACGPREAGSSETPSALDSTVLLRNPSSTSPWRDSAQNFSSSLRYTGASSRNRR
jgi:microcompartment protein CcmK/EutM